jgi:hypothetical protein
MILALCFTAAIAILIGFNIPALVGRALGGDDETPILTRPTDLTVPVGDPIATQGGNKIA